MNMILQSKSQALLKILLLSCKRTHNGVGLLEPIEDNEKVEDSERVEHLVVDISMLEIFCPEDVLLHGGQEPRVACKIEVENFHNFSGFVSVQPSPEAKINHDLFIPSVKAPISGGVGSLNDHNLGERVEATDPVLAGFDLEDFEGGVEMIPSVGDD
ncbi:hypothetical protein V6N12_044361 [Hibiscus sabdariffa]|uniref:Uncharacterized protein n=2 Tax=Hibiscus sabdariffa TaxID=183260 RepID=A0ABR2DHH5_9ROSI